MAELVLKNNYFEFNGEVFQQTSGTAIGSKFAPPYACIFMDKIEKDFLQTQKYQPLVWLRYIDDIFFIWNHGEENLKVFMNHFNNFHPNIKFTYDSSKESVIFLDLRVKSDNNHLMTTLYVKPTDKHQYLHYSSAHPDHTKRSIVFSQTLRISRLCSREEDFNDLRNQMKPWFLRREYPEKVIDAEMNKVKFLPPKRKTKTNMKGVPFVVTFHPKLKSLNRIIKNNLYILHMDQEVKTVFSAEPMVSFRSARKLSSYLVRAKLYQLLRKVGSIKCNKIKCEVCNHVTDTESFSSSVTGETFKINHHLNCDDKCIIYLLTCNQCKKQYVGETTNKFRFRWNNYKCNSNKFDKKDTCMQEHLYGHFKSPGHTGFLNDVSVTLIDKTDGSDPKKRENYWMNILRTIEPHGLNMEEGV